jgi:chromosome segregation ATPase
MIIRTAALTILTREFEKARSEIERALREVNGHVAQLTTSGNSDSGRSLNAMLRVPSDQLDSLLARLKSIGPVLEEAQRGQEVTSEFVDLVARLGNARNTEQRLIDVLRTRTGKVSDILEVEREIARVRGEIEQMEAQRKSLETRVRFATVQLDLREDYKVPLEVTPPSAGTQLWNSLVEGYRDAVGSLIDATLFVLRYAPLALLWSALLFWPARSAWRRLRTALS